MSASARQEQGKTRLAVAISLAGRVSIRANGTEIEEQRFPGRQGRLVFAYLATEEGRAVSRDELAEALWGDAPPATWEKALTVIVSKLRALLEESGVDGKALTSAFGCYRLDLPEGSTIDVVEARRAVDDFGDAALAAEIAARQFLPGDEGYWVEAQRRELADVRVRALERLVDEALPDDPTRAVTLAHQLVELEPYRESTYRRLMGAHIAAGNRAEALRVYERCRSFLADELGAYPSPETDAVYRRLLTMPEPGQFEELPARRRRVSPAVLAVALGIALLATAVGWVTFAGDERQAALSTGPAAVAAPSCGKVESLTENPDLLIASDLPLKGPSRVVARTMSDAIRLVLRHRQFEAGPYSLGYQSCDDATAVRGDFDLDRCAANALAYGKTPRLVAVIGTYNSPCAMAEVPILNRASAGPIAMISPANTFPGLTIGGPGSDAGEPEKFYPTGIRSFFRVVASDDLQAGAAAMLARELGVRRVYVLASGNPDDRYGRFVAQSFRRAARRIGIRVVGFTTWNSTAWRYDRLAEKVARSRPDGVFLGGVVFDHAGKVVTDLRAQLGRKVVLIAPDGFSPIPALLDSAPKAAIGMYISIAGLSNGALNPTGEIFMRELAVNRRGSLPAASYVPEAAQTAEVLLAAISRSDGSRRSVLEQLKATKVENGILGSFFFDRNGDISSAPIAIYRVTGNRRQGEAADFRGAVVDRVLHVPLTIVR